MPTNILCFFLLGFEVCLPKGGILADEMGLGKTVEVLSCVIYNPYKGNEEADIKKVILKSKCDLLSEDGQDDYQPKRKRMRSSVNPLETTKQHGIKSAKYKAMRRSYEMALSQMSCASASRTSSENSSTSNDNMIRCFCDENDSDSLKLVECNLCKTWLHAKCLNIENGYAFGDVKCPQCWSKSSVIPTKATLIITPPAILNQWIEEVSCFACLLYLSMLVSFLYILPNEKPQ